MDFDTVIWIVLLVLIAVNAGLAISNTLLHRKFTEQLDRITALREGLEQQTTNADGDAWSHPYPREVPYTPGMTLMPGQSAVVRIPLGETEETP